MRIFAGPDGIRASAFFLPVVLAFGVVSGTGTATAHSAEERPSPMLYDWHAKKPVRVARVGSQAAVAPVNQALVIRADLRVISSGSYSCSASGFGQESRCVPN